MSEARIPVAVAGASGYAGGELLRLIGGHPGLRLLHASAGSQAGEPITAVHPNLASLAGLAFAESTPDVLAQAALVFLALPHGASARLAGQLPDSVSVVDLGADYRLTDPVAWESYYGGPHAGAWTYGLPELPGAREAITASSRVANTGCYAVATILAAAPMIASGLASPDDVVVVAASGTSGAGRSPKAHLLASEVAGSLSVYKTGCHQHVPEIKQATGARTLSLTPMLAPMPRGILATVTFRPGPAGQDRSNLEDRVRQALARAYDREAFVTVLPRGRWPSTAAVAGTNGCQLQAGLDADSGRLIVVSAIDNLGKGAAGQAVQNANLMLSLPESMGLAVDGVAP